MFSWSKIINFTRLLWNVYHKSKMFNRVPWINVLIKCKVSSKYFMKISFLVVYKLIWQILTHLILKAPINEYVLEEVQSAETIINNHYKCMMKLIKIDCKIVSS